MSQVEHQEESPGPDTKQHDPFEYSTRLEFLYRIVTDSQETIRFLDTKAAFCVTLLTAMMAAAFGPLAQTHRFHQVHVVALSVFAAATLVTLALCLKVIFPTVHLQGTFSATGPASPTFFLPHKKSRYRIVQNIWNASEYPLSIPHDQYLRSVVEARDIDLVHSMCDEVITVSVLRQVKSDRLRAAITGLMLAVFLFFVQLVL
jgi:hypothetical protein